MNKWIGTGRLAADPEVRKSKDDKDICNFRVAVDRRFKRDGEPEADFLTCVAFGKTAEFVSKYFTKGKMIALDGRIQTRNWTDDKGQKHYATEIMVDNVEFCGGKRDDGDTSAGPDHNRKADLKPALAAPDDDDEDPDALPF